MEALLNHVAVVTGASSGVGKAIALGLAEQGAALGLVGRRLGALDAVADSARKTTSRVFSYRIDLTIDNEISILAKHVQRDLGAVDILVHSAGIASYGPVATASVENLDLQYRTNLRAPYLLTQALLPMIKDKRGQIVFINSTGKPRAEVSQYAASKYALTAVADSLRDELHPRGIRVLNGFIGRTATPLQAFVHETEGRPYDPESLLQPEDVTAVVINALTLPRTAEVTDITIRPLTQPGG